MMSSLELHISGSWYFANSDSNSLCQSFKQRSCVMWSAWSMCCEWRSATTTESLSSESVKLIEPMSISCGGHFELDWVQSKLLPVCFGRWVIQITQTKSHLMLNGWFCFLGEAHRGADQQSSPLPLHQRALAPAHAPAGVQEQNIVHRGNTHAYICTNQTS